MSGMALHGIAWHCMVLHGLARYGMVLHGSAWYCMVLHCIAWYYMVVPGRLEICQKIYTTKISGERFYTLRTRKSRLFSLAKQSFGPLLVKIEQNV